MKSRKCSVGVFLGSNDDVSEVYADAARDLAYALVDWGITVVYGGSNIGTMKILADAVLGRGGQIVGVIPQVLVDKELVHPGLTQCHVVDNMHTRKAKFLTLSDAFITLPGGLGTLEEMFEVLSWQRIGIHSKRCGLLNVDHYYDQLVAFLECATKEGFINRQDRMLLQVDTDVERLLEKVVTESRE